MEFLKTFVDDMLDLRALKAGYFSLVMQSFDLREVIQEVYEIFQPQVIARRLKLLAFV